MPARFGSLRTSLADTRLLSMPLTASQCMRITFRNDSSFSGIAGARADRFGDARAGQIRLPAHDRRDRAGVIAALVAVIRNAERHQHGAQIRVAEAERPEIVRILRDLLRRIAGVVHQNFLRQDHRVDRVPERLDIESCRPVPTNFIRFSDARLQAESSRNMYSEHGFDALMRAVAFDVCQRLIVVSNCMPGSPH